MECLQKKSEKPFSSRLQAFFHFKPFPSGVIYSAAFATFARTLGHTDAQSQTWKLPCFFACDTQLPVVGDTAALTNQRGD